MNISKIAEIGIDLLKEAVYEVLREQGRSMRSSDISRELDIPPIQPAYGYNIVTDILHKLKSDGRVDRDPLNTMRWQISDS